MCPFSTWTCPVKGVLLSLIESRTPGCVRPLSYESADSPPPFRPLTDSAAWRVCTSVFLSRLLCFSAFKQTLGSIFMSLNDLHPLNLHLTSFDPQISLTPVNGHLFGAYGERAVAKHCVVCLT